MVKLSGRDIAQGETSRHVKAVVCPWCEAVTELPLGPQHAIGDISVHCSKCSKFSRHIVADKWFDDHVNKEKELKEVWKKIPSDAFLTCRQSMRGTPFIYTLHLGGKDRPEEFFSRDTVEHVLINEFGMSQKQAAGALISAGLTPGLKIYLQRHTRLVMAVEKKEDMKRTGDAGIKTGTPIRCNGVNGLFLRYSANDGFAIVALPAAKGDEFGDAEVPVVDLEVIDAGGPEVAEDFEMEKSEEGEVEGVGTLEEALDHIDEAENIIEDIVLEEGEDGNDGYTEDDEMKDLDFSDEDEDDKDEGKDEEDKDLPFEANRRIAVEWSDLRKRPMPSMTGAPTVKKLQTLRSIIDDPNTDPQTLQDAQKQWTVLRKQSPQASRRVALTKMAKEVCHECGKRLPDNTPPDKMICETCKKTTKEGKRTANREAQRRVRVHYSHSGDLKRAIEANRQELSIEDIRTLTNFYANTGKIAHYEASEIAELFIGTKPRLLCAADEKKCKGCGKSCEGPIWGTTVCKDCADSGKTATKLCAADIPSMPEEFGDFEYAEEGMNGEEGKVCGECGSSSSECPKCGKDFLLGNVAYCPKCESPVECSGCAQVVSEDLDGVVSMEGTLIPWGTEKFEDVDLEKFFSEVGPAPEEKESAYENEGDEEPTSECPSCGGPGGILGQMGNRIHYRCRNCGMDFSQSTSARHKDGCECGFCSRMRENQDWKKNRGNEKKEAQRLRCQECGAKVPKGQYKCPKCGSEDIDIDAALCNRDLRRVAVAPPGRETEVRHLKDEPGVENPYALSWWKKEKGHKPHTKSSPHTKQKACLSSEDLKKKACIGIFTPATYDGSEVLVIAIDNTSLQATVQDGKGNQKVVDIADLKPVKKGPFTEESRKEEKSAAKKCKVCGDPMVPRKTFKGKDKKPVCSCPAGKEE